jgi:hypothetical protein
LINNSKESEMKSLFLAVLLIADPSASDTTSVEILTPTQTIVGSGCNPQYMLAPGGGTISAGCERFTSHPRLIPGTGEFGGEYVIRVADFSDAVFTNCQLLSHWRSITAWGYQSIISLTCEDRVINPRRKR